MKNLPTKEIIASTEATAQKLDAQTAEKLRTHMSRVIQSSTVPQCNLPGHLRKAVRDLRNDNTIVILPADKGNATVVMNKGEYEDKLGTMLTDGTYRRLKRDPTGKIERQIGTALRETEQKGEMTKERQLFLTP